MILLGPSPEHPYPHTRVLPAPRMDIWWATAFSPGGPPTPPVRSSPPETNHGFQPRGLPCLEGWEVHLLREGRARAERKETVTSQLLLV